MEDLKIDCSLFRGEDGDRTWDGDGDGDGDVGRETVDCIFNDRMIKAWINYLCRALGDGDYAACGHQSLSRLELSITVSKALIT